MRVEYAPTKPDVKKPSLALANATSASEATSPATASTDAPTPHSASLAPDSEAQEEIRSQVGGSAAGSEDEVAQLGRDLAEEIAEDETVLEPGTVESVADTASYNEGLIMPPPPASD